jgi:FAD:protein FMN transferase
MQTITLARHAMATRFEIVLHGDNPTALRAAGEEALDEIERLERQLSLFQPTSEIAHVNARAARESVRVSPPLFALLQHAMRLHEESGGAFDITIAPLMRCWGFMAGTGQLPAPAELDAARATVGMHLVELNPASFSIGFSRPGVMLDLGAIGKGYAIEQAAEILREAGVTRALIHGGTSTVYAIGAPPDSSAWTVAIEKPRPNSDVEPALLTSVPLCDEALSVSAISEKYFRANGRTFGHVLDPRTGQPVCNALLAAVMLKSATETDALSTALLVRGTEGHCEISSRRPGMKTLLVTGNPDAFHVETHGIGVPAAISPRAQCS